MKLNVLLVDDDEILLFVHQIMVKKNLFITHPLAFVNGKYALDFLLEDAKNESSTLILLDINMPEMNGWELLDAINKELPTQKIYVVIVTSSINFEDRIKADNYKQVVGYIEKPMTTKVIKGLKEINELEVFFN